MTPRNITITQFSIDFFGSNGVCEATGKFKFNKKAHRKAVIENDDDLISVAIDLFKKSPQRWNKNDSGVVVRFNGSAVYLIEDDVK